MREQCSGTSRKFCAIVRHGPLQCGALRMLKHLIDVGFSQPPGGSTAQVCTIIVTVPFSCTYVDGLARSPGGTGRAISCQGPDGDLELRARIVVFIGGGGVAGTGLRRARVRATSVQRQRREAAGGGAQALGARSLHAA